MLAMCEASLHTATFMLPHTVPGTFSAFTLPGKCFVIAFASQFHSVGRSIWANVDCHVAMTDGISFAFPRERQSRLALFFGRFLNLWLWDIRFAALLRSRFLFCFWLLCSCLGCRLCFTSLLWCDHIQNLLSHVVDSPAVGFLCCHLLLRDMCLFCSVGSCRSGRSADTRFLF